VGKRELLRTIKRLYDPVISWGRGAAKGCENVFRSHSRKQCHCIRNPSQQCTRNGTSSERTRLKEKESGEEIFLRDPSPKHGKMARKNEIDTLKRVNLYCIFKDTPRDRAATV